jgi:hypothetical protein
MALRIESFTFDAHDPKALATWWPEALGWTICFESPDGIEVKGEAFQRLLALGAQRVDVGQTGDESWVVLADPEGNQLCVLSPRP